MSAKRETKGKSWFFTIISMIWITAVAFLVHQATPKVYEDSGNDQRTIENYNRILDSQRDLMSEIEELYAELRNLDFGIYQDYKELELQERINAMTDPSKATSAHMLRAGQVFELLLNSRHKLAAEQRNILKNTEAVVNCQKGNQSGLAE